MSDLSKGDGLDGIKEEDEEDEEERLAKIAKQQEIERLEAQIRAREDAQLAGEQAPPQAQSDLRKKKTQSDIDAEMNKTGKSSGSLKKQKTGKSGKSGSGD